MQRRSCFAEQNLQIVMQKTLQSSEPKYTGDNAEKVSPIANDVIIHIGRCRYYYLRPPFLQTSI